MTLFEEVQEDQLLSTGEQSPWHWSRHQLLSLMSFLERRFAFLPPGVESQVSIKPNVQHTSTSPVSGLFWPC